MEPEQHVSVKSAQDVRRVARVVRAMSRDAGLPAVQTEEFVIAAMELASNLVRHATAGGSVICGVDASSDARSMKVIVTDEGPGIDDLSGAMTDGYSTGSSLGSGLPGARRLVDSFDIASLGNGTTIVIQKRLPTP